jgi:hypothetical protein
MSGKIVFYISKQDLETLSDAINVLEKIGMELGDTYTDLTLDLNMSLFHLRNFLENLRKHVRREEK